MLYVFKNISILLYIISNDILSLINYVKFIYYFILGYKMRNLADLNDFEVWELAKIGRIDWSIRHKLFSEKLKIRIPREDYNLDIGKKVNPLDSTLFFKILNDIYSVPVNPDDKNFQKDQIIEEMKKSV